MRLPALVEPGPELTTAELERYARHLSLPGIGEDGQRRLAAARVLVVGAGGLGSPALLYLAAAGVGTLGIVDDDDVDTSNLQRQVVHGTGDVGRPKTTSARDAVADVAPHVRCVEHRERLTSATAVELLGGYDLVLDGSDNFATRYLVSDAAELVGIPVVWGGLYRFTGQVSVFWAAPPAGVEGVTYRDVFPEPPPPALAPDCATGGVLGSLCGTIGSAMATEAIKLITGAGRTLLGRLSIHDALESTWRTLDVGADPSREPVTTMPDDAAYATLCGIGPGSGSETETEIRPGAAGRLVPADTVVPADAFVLDVREDWEIRLEPCDSSWVRSATAFLGDPEKASAAVGHVVETAVGRPVRVVCRTGARSARVAEVLRAAGLDAHPAAVS